MRLGITNDFVERLFQDVFELLVNDRLLPEEALAVLYPLKVGSCYTAGVRENVGNDEDVLVCKDVIGHRGGWSVSTLGDDSGFDLIGVVARNDVFDCGWNQDVRIHQEQLACVGRLCSLESINSAIPLAMHNQRIHIDAV